MSNFHLHFPFSPVIFCSGVVAVLAVTYVGLIAVVMSHAALTVGFSQSVRDDETAVALLEERYLSGIASLTSMNYVEAGYVKPIAELFVPVASVTALR